MARKNLKFISYFDEDFLAIAFFYHMYTKKRTKVYGFTITDIATMEVFMKPEGIDHIFSIASIYDRIKKLKKTLNIIYQ